jgi:hypothetical protein
MSAGRKPFLPLGISPRLRPSEFRGIQQVERSRAVNQACLDSHCPPSRVRFGNRANIGLRTPSRYRYPPRHRKLPVGRHFSGRAWCSNRNSSSWRTGDDRLRPRRLFPRTVGTTGRIRGSCHRRRLSPCACLASTPGDQSISRSSLSLGRGAQHSYTHRRQPARRLLGLIPKI